MNEETTLWVWGWEPTLVLVWIAGSVLIGAVGLFHLRYGNPEPYLGAYFVFILGWPIAAPMIFVLFPLAEWITTKAIDPLVFRFKGRRKND